MSSISRRRRRARIVATLDPSSSTKSMIRAPFEAGVDGTARRPTMN